MVDGCAGYSWILEPNKPSSSATSEGQLRFFFFLFFFFCVFFFFFIIVRFSIGRHRLNIRSFLIYTGIVGDRRVNGYDWNCRFKKICPFNIVTMQCVVIFIFQCRYGRHAPSILPTVFDKWEHFFFLFFIYLFYFILFLFIYSFILKTQNPCPSPLNPTLVSQPDDYYDCTW